MPLLRLIPILLIITACQRNLPPPRPNPYAVPAIVEFKLGGLEFRKSLELLPSDDSVSKSSLKVTPGLYDSIMKSLKISERPDRRHHYATVFYLDKDLHTDSIIKDENILGFGVYTVKWSVMHFKLYLKKDGIYSPADDFSGKVMAIYCHDNNAISRHFVKVNKTPVTWLPVFYQSKEPFIIPYKHELTKKLELLAPV